MPEIIVFSLQKPQETKVFHISPEEELNQECFIGRDDRCSIALQDTMVSRIHGKITFHNGIYYFTDLGSRNGSRVNNEIARLNQNYPLKSLDTITIGNNLLWIKEVGFQEANTSSTRPLTPQEYMPLANVDHAKIPRWTKGNLTVRCVQIIDETYDVKTFRFVAESPMLFIYQPGQFVTLSLNIDSKTVKRSYSISSTPSRPHTLDITVKRVSTPAELSHLSSGLVSNWLHENVDIGTNLKLTGPMGKFTNFVNPSQKVLLISAGSGINPMMSMIRWLYDTVSHVDIAFLYSARTPRDIVFRQELELIARLYPNFKLAITVNDSESNKPWYGYIGTLNESILRAVAPDFCDRNTYVCGSDSFMKEIKSLMKSLRFPMENYYQENFLSSSPVKSPNKSLTSAPSLISQSQSLSIVAKASQSDDSCEVPPTKIISSLCSQEVHSCAVNTSIKSEPPKTAMPIVLFAKSKKEVICNGEKSILDIAQAEGIDIPYGCGMGVCGQCKLPKISGEVIYDDHIECEKGHILTCVGQPVGKVVIDA